MKWVEMKIHTSPQGLDIVSGALISLGVGGLVIEDPSDFEEFLESKTPHWDDVDSGLMYLKDVPVSVTVYIQDNESGADLFAAVKTELKRLKQTVPEVDLGSLDYATAISDEQDWINNWKKYYKTLHLGKRLVVQPCWEEYIPKPDEVVLLIDPGVAFGTGGHETTALCLEKLETHVKAGDKLLDIGCGSGILSIASILFGADSAYAVDIDENAVSITIQNAELNEGVRDKLMAVQADLLSDEALRMRLAGKFTLVAANIVADVIIPLCAYFSDFLQPGGRLVVSGIIENRMDEVCGALKSGGFTIVDKGERNDWNAIVCTL